MQLPVPLQSCQTETQSLSSRDPGDVTVHVKGGAHPSHSPVCSFCFERRDSCDWVKTCKGCGVLVGRLFSLNGILWLRSGSVPLDKLLFCKIGVITMTLPLRSETKECSVCETSASRRCCDRWNPFAAVLHSCVAL